MVLVAIALAAAAVYMLLVAYLLQGWMRLRLFSPPGIHVHTSVTLVIPARNEEKNIEACLQCASAQNYPPHLFEILVADDASEDATAAIVSRFKEEHPALNLRCLVSAPDEKGGKKAMIEKSVREAMGELIVTTDADCRMGPEWVAVIAAYYEHYNPDMICGPVCFEKEKGIFQNMQALEFLSLIAAGAGSIAQGAPLMCNGANLAFRKDVFTECGGYEGNRLLPSGDDVFLMLTLHRRRPGSVHFLKSREVVVTTVPEASLSSLLSQRARWAGKTTVLSLLHRISLTAITVYLVNLILVLFALFACFHAGFRQPLLVLAAVKFFTDILYLLPVAAFFNKQKLLLLFLPLQVLYPFYAVVAGLLASFSGYSWKSRKYQKRFLKG